jgi:asparagine synthase (glutamine-hydrolysing)
MCGIAGFVGPGGIEVLRGMTSALAHRGPDDSGHHAEPQAAVFLGYRRLAVIDIAGGQQPMWNEDESVCVVFNGEIYNHAELRAALLEKGHRFRSDHSDTEVLVHGYEEWGDGLPLRLNGMFAFAIYDRPRRRIFMARDRFGEKPLFYAHRKGFFAFASELGALRRHPAFGADIDGRSLQKYFAYGYLPAPHAIYRGTFKLPGGHHLLYDLAAGTLAVRPYWRFRLAPDLALEARPEEELAEELRGLLYEAVRRRLISDVPLGVFLSGGLDSTAVVLGATRSRASSRIKTFNIAFREPSFDESEFARMAAEHFGTEHHERLLDKDWAVTAGPGVLARLDEPLADPSILPTYLLSGFAREQVTVALSGDGGDELFAGYDPFKALAPAALYARLMPSGLHRGLRRLADLLPASDRNMSLEFKIKRALMGLSYPQEGWTPVWMSLLEPGAMREVFLSPVRFEELYDEAIALWTRDGAGDLVDRCLEFFTNFYLPDDILTKVDRASMMVSLESRAVFLDNDLVAFCQRLPNRFKFRNGQGKYLLRKALRGLVPDAILDRPKKGFGMPVAKWLREMTPPPLRPIDGIRREAVEARWRQHRARSADHRLFLWGWMALQGVLAGDPTATAAPAAQPR